MSNLSTKVNDIYNGVEKLILLQKELIKENNRLNNENKQLVSSINHQKQIIQELENKNKLVKLAKSLSEVSNTNSDVKLKVNEIIREVDKCIALLNR
jgi:regulator of replication initiation timing